MTDYADDGVLEADTPPFYCVSIYMVDRAYGGSEEGGWWYDCGEPALEYAEHTRIFTTLEDARAYREELHELCGELNVGRRDIGSVLSDGQYAAIVDWGHYPTAYPATRPHYE